MPTPTDSPNKAHSGKRLLVVSQHYWPENFRVNDLVDGFIEAGVEVDVLCGLPNYPAGEWFEGYRYTGPRRQQHGGAQLFRAGEIRRKGNTALRIFLNYCSFPFFALFSLPRLAGRKYDAVLCYETSPVLMLFPAIVASRLRQVPLTGYVLDLWPDNLYSVLNVESPFLRRVAEGVSRWHYRRCHRLVALSGGAAQRLQGMCAKNGKKTPDITVIPQYSEDFYAEDTPDDALQKKYGGAFNILFAGNISPAQDLENLVRAIKTVRQTPGGKNVRVLILGDGMSRAALEGTIAREGVAEAFTFCGQVPPADIPKWTGMADALFAGLSASANLDLTVPAKITSYLAAGRPMLVAAGGEAARVAAQSGAALVSSPGNDDALAQNILRLVAMPPEGRAQMGRAGRECWRQSYRRETLLGQLVDTVFTNP